MAFEGKCGAVVWARSGKAMDHVLCESENKVQLTHVTGLLLSLQVPLCARCRVAIRAQGYAVNGLKKGQAPNSQLKKER